MCKVQVSFRKVLLSSGSLTVEAVISNDQHIAYESSPEGLTLGRKEKFRGSGDLPREIYFDDNLIKTQIEFDREIASQYEGEISTALSLAYLRFSASCSNISSSNLYNYISKTYKTQQKSPRLIFNILNGGKHAGSSLNSLPELGTVRDVNGYKKMNIKIGDKINWKLFNE